MEHLLAFVVPMLALAAMTVGWLTDTLSPTRDDGLIIDMAVGFAGGAAVAAVLFGLNRLGDGGLFVTFLVGIVGAALAVAGQRMLWKRPALAA